MGTLHTSRLALKKLTPEIYERVFSELSQKEARQFFNFMDEERFETELERYRKGLITFNKSMLYFYLIHRDSGKNIGWCGYHTWYTDHHRAEIGYGFSDLKFSGNGLMTEAMEAIIAYGFDEMNLHRIEAFVAPDNQASLALLARFHFMNEGHFKEHYWVEGTPEDSLAYALLRPNYEALRSK